ncbi:MAG: serine/threonine protein kinase [Phycisphaerales bacterium]|nr:serine/threonine protein kinase [Phycisphaerales bacterium]
MANGRSAELPKTLFGYEVLDYIGQGAGSQLYVVSDPSTRQLYTLKHVIRATDKDIRFVEQLEVEYEVGQRVRHQALRRSIDLKHRRSFLGRVLEAVLVLELVDGQTLENALPHTLKHVLRVFIQTASALHAMHEIGFVHCDLKPSNILIDAQGDVKVIDLGQAARIGVAKQRIQGTPDYIAPEQVKREPVTARTDIFNFGATLYWALAGKKLPTLYTINRGENSFLLDGTIETPRQANPTIPEPLSDLTMLCVRSNPIRRPENMLLVQNRLEFIQHGLTHSSIMPNHAPGSPER